MSHTFRAFARLFTAVYITQTLLASVPAYSQVTASPGAPSGQKPLIDAAANGVPLVLIAPPNPSGVSRNQYGQFNVAPGGLILHNATGNVQTRLGGWVKGNMQLGAAPARIILNEVTGATVSQLRGAIEVAGQRADVVIANPNGVSCDGCGFLNTSRATLSTGTPLFSGNGSLTGFDVRQGVLSIGPGGLSAMEQQQLDLHARNLNVDGEVWTHNLQAILGANMVRHSAPGSGPEFTPYPPGSATGDTPRFAVDIKALGGMYAGSIYLIATEKGLGVNSTGRLATLAGNLVLSANGELTLKDSYSAADTRITAQGQASLTGQNQAEGSLGVQGQGVRTAGASVMAQRLEIDAGAAALHNEAGSLRATSAGADAIRLSATGIGNEAGVIQANGAVLLDLHGGQLHNAAGLLAGGAVTVTNAQQVHNRAGSIDSAADLSLVTGALDTTGGTIGTGGHLGMQTGELRAEGARVTASGNVAVIASASADVGSSTWSAGQNLALAAGGSLGAAGAKLRAGGRLSLQGSGITTTHADIAANGTVTINAGTAELHNEGGVVYSAQGETRVVAGALHNAGGVLAAATALTVEGGPLHNTEGVLSGAHSASLSVRGLVNDAGVIEAGAGGLTIDTQSQALRNAASGSARGIVSSGSIRITAGEVVNTVVPGGSGGTGSGTPGSAGYIGAGGTLTIIASGSVTNTSGAIITAAGASIDAAGELANAGLINSTEGATSIRASVLRNTGRIYGDSVAIAGAVFNSADAAGAGAVIASRSGDLRIEGPVSNTSGGLILSLNDLSVTGAVANEGATLSASRHLTIGGALANTNAALSLTSLTRHDATGGFFIQPAGSTATWRPDELLYVSRESGAWVLPSHVYPLAQFGGAARPLMSSCADPVDGNTVCGNFYSATDPIWQLMGVASPGSPGEPPAGCANDLGEGAIMRVTTGSCGGYWSGVDAWNASLPARHAALDAAITAFNQDLAARTVNNWYELTVTGQTVSETAVTASRPGQVLAGGNVTLAAGTNQDSIIVAGGNLDGGALQNLATKGQRQATQEGTKVYSWGDHDGGLFGSGWRRNRSEPQPIANAPVVTSFDLPLVRLLAGTPPASVVAPVAMPPAPVPSPRVAPVPAGGPVPAVQHASGTAPLPVKAEGFLTVTSQGVVRVPGSQLFALNRAPGARYLVETDPAFTGYRNWLASDYFLAQLALDPERSFKRYGDGFAEQRLVDDQILALTGRRYLSGYSSTEAEYQDLLDAGVQFAKRLQLSPGVTLSAEQMASLTSDIVWLEVKAVALPDGSTVQALVPTVYLRRPVEGDVNPAGALVAGANVTLRSAADQVNSGTIAATGDAATGAGHLVIEGLNLQNAGTLAGHTVKATAAHTLDNLGGVVQGLGPASAVTLNARDIILRTTTQTSSREVSGSGGTSTGTATNADRIATIAADSVTLAALNNIDLKGASVKATGDLTATAGGSITSDAVQTGYTLHVPQGGSSKGRTGHYQAEASTQHLTALQAGGNLSVTASGDASFKGTNADAGGNLTVQAANISIEAAKEKHAIDHQGVRNSGYERFAQSDETLAGGVFTAGNNAALTATADKAQGQGNITMTGAVVAATSGQASLTATGNVVVQNAATSHTREQESYASSKGFLSSSSSQRDSASQTTAVQGSTVSGSAVDIQAGGNIAIQGSGVVSDTQTTLNAAGNVSITAATQTYTSSSFAQDRKSGLGALGGLSFGSHQQSTGASETATRAVSSNIGSLQGNVNITAGQTYTQTGSHVVAPHGDVTISGEKVLITEARETASSQLDQKFRQSGIAVTVSNPLISALETTGQMARQAGKTDDPRMKALAVAAAAIAVNDAAKEVARNPDKLGGVGINFSLGTKQQQSNASESSNTSAGSTVAAGGNVTITARGDGDGPGKSSNLIVQGSRISAGNTASLKADGQVQLLAAQDTREQHTTSSGSSAGVGMGINFGTTTNGFSFSANASSNKGNSDGSSTTHLNAQVTAGNTVNIESAGDTVIKGAVVSAHTVNAKVGGNLVIESLQDTSSFTEQQKSAGIGVTLCLPPICGGASSVTGSAGRSDINSNYRSVTEQSAIRAGDGGFNVDVNGGTTLAGGAITSTQKAVDEGRNTFQSKEGVTLTDIQNTASYKADGFSLTAGYSGTPHDKAGNPDKDSAGNPIPGKVISGGGIGSDSGKASSVAQAGISGIAGNKEARTGDAESGIKPIFDANKVRDDVNAQTAITQAALPGVTRAWAAIANEQEHKAQTPEERACWAEGGACRVAGHVAIGALAGGTAGAAGAGVSQAVVPAIGDALKGADVPEGARQAIVAGLGAAIGAAAGGTAGAITGGNATVNNYLTKAQWESLNAERAQCATDTCRRELDRKYGQISAQQDAALRAACADLNSPSCRSLVDEAQEGSKAQTQLAASGQLPANYLAGRDFNSNVNLFVQRVQAQDVVNACNANPVQCDQARLVGSAKLLLTGASMAAAVALFPVLGLEVAAMANMGGPGQYCLQRMQSCLNIINAAAEAVAGVPVSGVNSPAGGGRTVGRTTGVANEPEANFAGQIPVRPRDGIPSPGTPVTQTPLGTHLIEAQVVGKGKNAVISGGHNMENFTTALTSAGGAVISKIEVSPGIYQINYQFPGGKIQPKTVFDPSIYSNLQMANMASEAAARGIVQWGVNGNVVQFVDVDGVAFRVPIAIRDGKASVPTAFPVSPNEVP
ncbi:MAG: hemagglutinin repeat-containing protein [Pseudomonadota bacterium]